MRWRILCQARSQTGQSLIETALVIPLLLFLAFNAINFGYFFFVAVNIAAAPRTGAEYSIQGFQTPSQPAIPFPGPSNSIISVSFLTYEDMRGVLPSSSSARLQVCNSNNGLIGTGSSQTAACTQYGSGGQTWTPAPDPEAPYFVLDRVDVAYTLSPLIPSFQLPMPGGPMTLNLLPSLTIHRQISMREMN